jgi:hypothetical protein
LLHCVEDGLGACEVCRCASGRTAGGQARGSQRGGKGAELSADHLRRRPLSCFEAVGSPLLTHPACSGGIQIYQPGRLSVQPIPVAQRILDFGP